MPERPTRAPEWISLVLDPGWSTLLDDVVAVSPIGWPGYEDRLAAVREETGARESVTCARGSVEGHPVVLVVFEFPFLGGSMGIAAGERIARAFEIAAREQAAVVAITASGGARIQEGMLALAQMPATVAARAEFANTRRPFVAYLTHPTTGGVYASFAGLADFVWAEPGATIGFAGPRVAAAATGEPRPPGSYTAERAVELGLADDVVSPAALRERLARALRALAARPRGPAAPEPREPLRPDRRAWDQLLLSRRGDRPSGGAYLDALLRDSLAMCRGGSREQDRTVSAALGRIDGRRAVVVALDRHAGDGRVRPAGYRRARTALATAERLGVPVVTLVDTPGADPSAGSEADGVAREIALTLDAFLHARVATVACVVGEGGSGGALAFAAADRVLIQENAVFSVISPEGAAAVFERDDVETLAGELKLTAHDLRELGLADRVVAEPSGGAHTDVAAAERALREAVCRALDDLRADRPFGSLQLVFSKRQARWRDAGRRHLLA